MCDCEIIGYNVFLDYLGITNKTNTATPVENFVKMANFIFGRNIFQFNREPNIGIPSHYLLLT